jgi:hypothetical protein
MSYVIQRLKTIKTHLKNKKGEKRMKNLINKTKLSTTILIALLTISAFTLLTVQLNAQEQEIEVPITGPIPAGETATVTISPTAHLSFRPNPIGLNQIFLVNLWTTPALYSGRYHPDYKVTITKPSGQQHVVTMDSYNADATAWFEWIADEVGDWTIRFDFQGTYFPEGYYEGVGFFGGGITYLDSAYYEPATSGDWTLTVQEDIVYSWPEPGITDDYWTRPVQVEHRDWWPSLGNWPAPGYDGTLDQTWDDVYPDTNKYWSAQHKFTPWVEGPDSAHIVWKRQEDIAGMIGGQAKQFGLTGSVPSPDIIYAGRAYDTYTPPGIDAPQLWRCYDIRTGETIWEFEPPQGVTTMNFFGFTFTTISSVTPDFIEYTAPTQSEVPGAEAAGTWSVNLISIAGERMYKWDPWTGDMTANVSLGVSGGTFYRQPTQRDTLPMVLTVQNIGNDTNPNYRLINWTTSGTSNNFAGRVLSNTTYARSSLPSYIDWETGIGATVSGISEAQVYVGQRITAYDLYTGVELWTKDVMDEPLYSNSASIADHGKVAILSARGYYLAYNLATGNLAWKGEQMDYPWAAAGFGAYSAMSGYGMIFRESMDGIYAYSWEDGSIVWKYEAPAKSVYETPYTSSNNGTVMPFYSFGVGGQIADGKFYTWNYEHTESWPVTRGWSLHAIDVFTGEGVWNILGCMTPTAIADGYLVATNSYDGYAYCFGKGQSQTTVTAPDVAIPKGTAMTIKGKVLDLSPAQPGTPCVSSDSMDTQMEYLHMQMPIGGLWGDEIIEGVPVALTAIGEDGSYVDIGTVTTDGYSGAFGIAWTPTEEGTYKIVASFEGDVSYGSSSDTTFVTVGPAPTPAQPIEPEIPETPETPEEPETPETPEEPETPETPEEPETPETPETPEEPENPEEPEPETSETPLISTEVAIIAAVAIASAIGAVSFYTLKKRK